MNCKFCNDITEQQILLETTHFKVIFDIDPIQHGHLLIISNQHILDIRELSMEQQLEVIQIEKAIITILERHFSIPGVSVIQNNGTIMDEGTHFHVHLIPRYIDDDFWTYQLVKEHELSLQELKDCLKLLNSI